MIWYFIETIERTQIIFYSLNIILFILMDPNLKDLLHNSCDQYTIYTISGII